MEYTSDGVAPSSGLLAKRTSMTHFDLTRIAPSEALAPFVENYWVISWDLTDKPAYTQENLPHPSVNMVVDPQANTGIWGIQTGIWTYTMSGTGQIFGTKFRPGAFHTFCKSSVQKIMDSSVFISSIFSRMDADLEARLCALNDPAGLARDIEAMLLAANPTRDSHAEEAERLVRLIADTPEIMQNADLAKAADMSVRSLQRLFDTYVGVGPKWVIDRYRMLAAVDDLNRGEEASLTSLAHDLGYFDQAHFTNRFRALTGHPPSHYLS